MELRNQTVINSKDKPIPAPQVMIYAAQEQNDTEYPTEVVLTALAEELTMPGTDMVQIGNTVFIGHRGEGKYKNVMEGRALNVDTGRNFINNGLKYIAYLQRKGIKYYRSDFRSKQFLTAFQYWHQKSEDSDTEIAVVQLDTGGYRAFITIGEDSLKEFWSL